MLLEANDLFVLEENELGCTGVVFKVRHQITGFAGFSPQWSAPTTTQHFFPPLRLV